jgi:hypothetical protein
MSTQPFLAAGFFNAISFSNIFFSAGVFGRRRLTGNASGIFNIGIVTSPGVMLEVAIKSRSPQFL